jgi:hypothetical protein
MVQLLLLLVVVVMVLALQAVVEPGSHQARFRIFQAVQLLVLVLVLGLVLGLVQAVRLLKV